MLENPITPEVLSRFTRIVQQYAPSYYCMVSYCIGIVPPKTRALVKDKEPYFLVSVFTYWGTEGADPQVCAVHATTLNELAKKLHRALDEMGEGQNPTGYLPAAPEQVKLLLNLIADARTCGPTRLECFAELAPMLNQWGATEMAQMLADRIISRQPGAPGFAAMHGLHTDGQA